MRAKTMKTMSRVNRLSALREPFMIWNPAKAPYTTHRRPMMIITAVPSVPVDEDDPPLEMLVP